LQIADCGRTADCELGIADCGSRSALNVIAQDGLGVQRRSSKVFTVKR
jgi:hypothetical protein